MGKPPKVLVTIADHRASAGGYLRRSGARLSPGRGGGEGTGISQLLCVRSCRCQAKMRNDWNDWNAEPARLWQNLVHQQIHIAKNTSTDTRCFTYVQMINGFADTPKSDSETPEACEECFHFCTRRKPKTQCACW